jgi:hypothetical protein
VTDVSDTFCIREVAIRPMTTKKYFGIHCENTEEEGSYSHSGFVVVLCFCYE